MNDVTKRIYDGTMTMFVKKGLQATTKEIAEEAGVAEVTLFRRYTNKENLFKTVIQSVIDQQFCSFMFEIAARKDTEDFFALILENRFEVIHKNYELVKMLLSESLRSNLTEQINLPNVISAGIKEGVRYHFELKNEEVDANFCSRQLIGVVLSYVVISSRELILDASEEERRQLAMTHAKAIIVKNYDENIILS